MDMMVGDESEEKCVSFKWIRLIFLIHQRKIHNYAKQRNGVELIIVEECSEICWLAGWARRRRCLWAEEEDYSGVCATENISKWCGSKLAVKANFWGRLTHWPWIPKNVSMSCEERVEEDSQTQIRSCVSLSMICCFWFGAFIKRLVHWIRKQSFRA